MHWPLGVPYSERDELQRKHLGSFDDEQYGDKKKKRTGVLSSGLSHSRTPCHCVRTGNLTIGLEGWRTACTACTHLVACL